MQTCPQDKFTHYNCNRVSIKNRLTPMKCTGQVDSGALDQFLSSPHVVLYSAVVSSSCSAELCSFLGKDGLRYSLRTPCNSKHSVFIGQCSKKQMTYHSAAELVSRHTSHTVNGKIGTTFNTGLSKKHHASSSHQEKHCIPHWQTTSRHGCVCVVFQVQFEVLLAS